MSYEIIDTFAPIVTVRKTQDDSFRPAATEPDLMVALNKAKMEGVEIEALRNLEVTPISTAVHTEQNLAIRAVAEEAIERLSLAAWWVYRRRMLGRLSISSLDFMKAEESLSLAGAQIPHFGSDGCCAVCIATNRSEYPFAVLGVAYKPSADEAIQKAVLEALQSWNGSQWYRRENPQAIPHWDLRELVHRQAEMQMSSPVESSHDTAQCDTKELMQLPPDLTVHSKGIVGGYFAWTQHSDVRNHSPLELAKVLELPNEKPAVFTRPNW